MTITAPTEIQLICSENDGRAGTFFLRGEPDGHSRRPGAELAGQLPDRVRHGLRLLVRHEVA